MSYRVLEIGVLKKREKYGNPQYSMEVKIEVDLYVRSLEIIVTKTEFELNFSVYDSGKELKDDDLVSYLEEILMDDILNNIDDQLPNIDI